MKILIVGVPRSGTTSLLNSICNFNYLRIGEPYNYSLGTFYKFPLVELEKYKRVCVKSIILESPDNFKGSLNLFYLKWIDNFDRVILLDRLNEEEHLKSFINLYYRVHKNQSAWVNWRYSEIPNNFIEEFKKSKQFSDFYHAKLELQRLSYTANIPITYYEDLYGLDRDKSKKIIQDWDLILDIDKLNKLLHPKFKLNIEYYAELINKRLI
jgi:GTPase SAR1 family protein